MQVVRFLLPLLYYLNSKGIVLFLIEGQDLIWCKISLLLGTLHLDLRFYIWLNLQ